MNGLVIVKPETVIRWHGGVAGFPLGVERDEGLFQPFLR
jgi:hypothetical protein